MGKAERGLGHDAQGVSRPRRHGKPPQPGRARRAKTASRGAPAVCGIVALGYPFRHPDRGEEPARTAHLAALRVPTLILQGARDGYGNAAAAARYALSPAITVEELPGVAHKMQLPPAGWDRIAARISRFAGSLPAPGDQGFIPAWAPNLPDVLRLPEAGRI